MRVDLLTIFPELFAGFANVGMVRIARDKGLLDLRVHDIREQADPPRRQVDDKPFGGGAGMVFRPEAVFRTLESLIGPPGAAPADTRLLLPAPVGRPFVQATAHDWASSERLVLFCARYEGYDERIVEAWGFEEVSLGDFIVTGGEVPAMAMVEAAIRLVPGVLGHDLGAGGDSFEGQGLDHPHYTRPAIHRGFRVPDLLQSGDHARVARWRAERSAERTATRRPDLLGASASKPTHSRGESSS